MQNILILSNSPLKTSKCSRLSNQKKGCLVLSQKSEKWMLSHLYWPYCWLQKTKTKPHLIPLTLRPVFCWLCAWKSKLFLTMYSEARSKNKTNCLIKAFINQALQSTSQHQSQIDQYNLVTQKEPLSVLLMSWFTHTAQDYDTYFIMTWLGRIGTLFS